MINFNVQRRFYTQTTMNIKVLSYLLLFITLTTLICTAETLPEYIFYLPDGGYAYISFNFEKAINQFTENNFTSPMGGNFSKSSIEIPINEALQELSPHLTLDKLYEILGKRTYVGIYPSDDGIKFLSSTELVDRNGVEKVLEDVFEKMREELLEGDKLDIEIEEKYNALIKTIVKESMEFVFNYETGETTEEKRVERFHIAIKDETVTFGNNEDMFNDFLKAVSANSPQITPDSSTHKNISLGEIDSDLVAYIDMGTIYENHSEFREDISDDGEDTLTNIFKDTLLSTNGILYTSNLSPETGPGDELHIIPSSERKGLFEYNTPVEELNYELLEYIPSSTNTFLHIQRPYPDIFISKLELLNDYETFNFDEISLISKESLAESFFKEFDNDKFLSNCVIMLNSPEISLILSMIGTSIEGEQYKSHKIYTLNETFLTSFDEILVTTADIEVMKNYLDDLSTGTISENDNFSDSFNSHIDKPYNILIYFYNEPLQNPTLDEIFTSLFNGPNLLSVINEGETIHIKSYPSIIPKLSFFGFFLTMARVTPPEKSYENMEESPLYKNDKTPLPD